MNVGFQWQKMCCCCYRLGDPTAIQIRDGGAKDRFGRQTTNTTIRNCLHHGKKEKAPELTTFDDGSSGNSVFHSLDSIHTASLFLLFLVEGGYMTVKRHDCSSHQLFPAPDQCVLISLGSSLSSSRGLIRCCKKTQSF